MNFSDLKKDLLYRVVCENHNGPDSTEFSMCGFLADKNPKHVVIALLKREGEYQMKQHIEYSRITLIEDIDIVEKAPADFKIDPVKDKGKEVCFSPTGETGVILGREKVKMDTDISVNFSGNVRWFTEHGTTGTENNLCLLEWPTKE